MKHPHEQIEVPPATTYNLMGPYSESLVLEETVE